MVRFGISHVPAELGRLFLLPIYWSYVMNNAQPMSRVCSAGLTVLLALCIYLLAALPLSAEDCVNCNRGDVTADQPYTLSLIHI